MPNYVGTFCAIPDGNPATWRIASECYRNLFAGETLGEAFRRARPESRKLDPRVWTMYASYGLPNQRLSLRPTE